MKDIACAVIALACILGFVVADYGYGGGYGASYVPVLAGYGGKGGVGTGRMWVIILML